MKRKMISCASALFFLAVFNCKRDKPDPECRDASCCGYPWEYFRDVHDEPVSLTGPPYALFHSVHFTEKISTSATAVYPKSEASICHKSLHKIEGLPFTHKSKAAPDSFPYRVSGKLLIHQPKWTLVYNPSFALYIDKIERIN